MDYDQLVLCDLAPLFDQELGDHLLAAHMQGPGVDMAYAMRVWLKRPLPEGWEHVAGHPYFLMPPLLNLKAMREAGTWERFMAAHAAFGADEQLSLTAATEGRTLPLDRKWNLFPKLHIADGEVPAGVIHWSGWPKPWHKGAKVWRPDIWESEQASWEHLRLGAWEDPAKWLDGAPVAPAFLVAQGAMDAEEADRLRLPGYDAEARLMTGEWPGGGPLPRALEYQAPRRGSGVGPGEALYLRRTAAARAEAPPRVAKQPERPAPRHLERIGLCVIATANYRMYIRPLLRSVRRNFLPGYEVTVLLFTDGAIAAEEDLRVIPVEHSRWPGMAIRRYPLFREHAAVFERMDYLYYLDADMRAIDKVGPEILGDLVATVHPGFHDKPREKFTYERRQESTACIEPDDGIRYYCGAFQGGRTERYLEAVDMMAERIDMDTAKGITAVWHDESDWNRYLIEHPPTLELCPSYCWYPDGRSRDFEGKFAVVLKRGVDAGMTGASVSGASDSATPL
jgi:hypothetical protein